MKIIYQEINKQIILATKKSEYTITLQRLGCYKPVLWWLMNTNEITDAYV